MGIRSRAFAQPGLLAVGALSAAMVLGLLQADHIRAQTAAPTIAIPADATFLNGDSWQASASPGSATNSYRLYGVQSCLRGTSVMAEGQRRDCGEISKVYLAGLARLGRPQCRAVAESTSPRQTLVICRATLGQQEVDLGQAMIAVGFAFAAYAPNGEPVALAYVAAEELARKEKAGLWRYADLPHPTPILLGALKQRGSIPRAN
ncbi:MAG: thermonuclease family protein [Beijerinckiaceae bacterium]